MIYTPALPRLLIIDDLFGRTHSDRLNRERANLCAQYLIKDVTGDEIGKGTPQHINNPIAEAVFCRGQTPSCGMVGDVIKNDLEGTLRLIREGWVNLNNKRPNWAMVLLDLHFYTGQITEESNNRTKGLPEGSLSDDFPNNFFGLKLLEAIKAEFDDLPVVILSSKPRQDVSEDFTKKGAVGFLPRADEKSPELLKEYIWKYGLIPDDSGKIIGHSKQILKALQKARLAASHRLNILIQGERGTGKELLARYIHRQSLVIHLRPFIEVDSGALSPELYASELFGYKKGAFTGAINDRIGRIKQADEGDLFLDEIGNMPPEVQMGLLRVTEQGVVSPLGSQENSKVDVRFITATNENMDEKASSGLFKQDLLDRLKEGGILNLIPLRDRLEDINILAEHLVHEAELSSPKAMKRHISSECFDILRAHEWSGNIRELRSCIYNAVFSYPDVEYLQPHHLQLGQTTNVRSKSKPIQTVQKLTNDRTTTNNIGLLLRNMKDPDLNNISSEDLLGKLPQSQEAYGHLFIQLLKCAIIATNKRVALEDSNAKLSYHPAIKLLSNDDKISATDASRIIKRQIKLSPEIQQLIKDDPILNKALNSLLN